ncbi:hypothetical protein D3C84_1146070 [compost metagenome]
MRLVEQQVAAVSFAAGAKEMVEPHFEQIGRTGVTGDVATQFAISLVGPHHHGQRVPAHQRRQAPFNGQVTGERRLLFQRDAIDVRRAVR